MYKSQIISFKIHVVLTKIYIWKSERDNLFSIKISNKLISLNRYRKNKYDRIIFLGYKLKSKLYWFVSETRKINTLVLVEIVLKG